MPKSLRILLSCSLLFGLTAPHSVCAQQTSGKLLDLTRKSTPPMPENVALKDAKPAKLVGALLFKPMGQGEYWPFLAAESDNGRSAEYRILTDDDTVKLRLEFVKDGQRVEVSGKVLAGENSILLSTGDEIRNKPKPIPVPTSAPSDLVLEETDRCGVNLASREPMQICFATEINPARDAWTDEARLYGDSFRNSYLVVKGSGVGNGKKTVCIRSKSEESDKDRDLRKEMLSADGRTSNVVVAYRYLRRWEMTVATRMTGQLPDGTPLDVQFPAINE